MSRFLLFYFIFYGGAHVYFLHKLRRAFPLSFRFKALLAITLPLIFLAPLLARTMEKGGLETAAGFASLTGYWWMGLLFLFVSAAAFLDLINLPLFAAAKLKQKKVFSVSAGAGFVLPAIYALVIGAYGWHEAKSIRTEQLRIVSRKIPAKTGRIRIVQISDVHAGQIVRESRVSRILQVVQAASPDILIATGDLVDGHQKHFKGLENLFQEIKPPLGKYAITGNHEYYVGIEDALKFTRAAGFKVLVDENATIAGFLTLTGLDDLRHDKLSPAKGETERKLLAAVNRENYTLLLKHRPDIEKSSLGQFDLQLSGHVHKGQIFPFNFITWIAYPIKTGLTDLGSGSAIYVSRGTGVWGPPIRFLAPPEVTVIDLVAEHQGT